MLAKLTLEKIRKVGVQCFEIIEDIEVPLMEKEGRSPILYEIPPEIV